MTTELLSKKDKGVLVYAVNHQEEKADVQAFVESRVRFEAEGGLGIGLALVHELVKLHAGETEMAETPSDPCKVETGVSETAAGEVRANLIDVVARGS